MSLDATRRLGGKPQFDFVHPMGGEGRRAVCGFGSSFTVSIVVKCSILTANIYLYVLDDYANNVLRRGVSLRQLVKGIR